MNIKRAWAVLWREPEPVERVVEVEKPVETFVPVGDNVVDIYTARDREYLRRLQYAYGGYGGISRPAEWHGKTYRSCADAFAAHGEAAEVSAHKAIVIGDEAYVFQSLVKEALPPKPKVAKGRAE